MVVGVGGMEYFSWCVCGDSPQIGLLNMFAIFGGPKGNVEAGRRNLFFGRLGQTSCEIVNFDKETIQENAASHFGISPSMQKSTNNYI